jgi:hypothetical protein
MIEIIGEPRDATEEEIKEYTRKQERPEWQQRMMNNFLRRPKCHPTASEQPAMIVGGVLDE